jgi:hypothetical protein
VVSGNNSCSGIIRSSSTQKYFTFAGTIMSPGPKQRPVLYSWKEFDHSCSESFGSSQAPDHPWKLIRGSLRFRILESNTKFGRTGFRFQKVSCRIPAIQPALA